MIEEYGVNRRQSCKTLSVSRSSNQYQPKAKDDIPVIKALQSLAERHSAIGFWQSHFRLRPQGFNWNHKKVYRNSSITTKARSTATELQIVLNKITRECQEREDSIRLESEQRLFDELTKMESFIAEANSQQYELKIAEREKKSSDLRK